jgi:hypothetical protein
LRNFRKLKELSDYKILDVPEKVNLDFPPTIPPVNYLYILRMLVQPKYGEFRIPKELQFLNDLIHTLSFYDIVRTGIRDSWCYVTVRHGKVVSETDDAFHFDGSSFRTDIIPERNYIWANHSPTEYKMGALKFPKNFDPIKHNLFTFAEHQLKNTPIKKCSAGSWYLLSPFCLHRRPNIPKGTYRTFYRICFTDIEGRDINNTANPLLPTPFYGRDPVKTFRNKLINYY